MLFLRGGRPQEVSSLDTIRGTALRGAPSYLIYSVSHVMKSVFFKVLVVPEIPRQSNLNQSGPVETIRNHFNPFAIDRNRVDTSELYTLYIISLFDNIGQGDRAAGRLRVSIHRV